MIRAVSVEIDVNLEPLSRMLWRLGIKHRISEESGNQVLWVLSEQHAIPVRQLLDSWEAGRLDLEAFNHSAAARTDQGNKARQAPQAATPITTYVLQTVRIAPVTTLLILISAVVALVTVMGSEPFRLAFLFYPSLPTENLLSLLLGINSPELFLRTLAPMFLHFGELHIIFNSLWLFYFGRQLEELQSSWNFLLVVVLTSFAGNTAQYLTSGAANFGGMSGVVYGLVGYAWILHNFVPGKQLKFKRTMFGFFIIALLLMEFIASDWIATAAHIGGLLTGLILGMLLVVKSRFANN